ncbi:beta-N-acetylhexosaminidase [Sphingobacterium sp. SRCM116780]|uniref:beta-N-acetylhexosaminidase n=1 Tax=Sphingobacterium sp. SRCM116780 TaxID=2907623 RepID=UPI001F1E80BC|nr:beta-N-acetylhexosaminidase [Sphingobacterium sp. SRCM116780]UIR57517.1 beta-N-acetylhexosaminidase [Sphingobacterium sp. SRCM116780]
MIVNKLNRIALLITIFIVSYNSAKAQLSIIPKPERIQVLEEEYVFPASSKINILDEEFESVGRYLQQQLLSKFGFTSTIAPNKSVFSSIQFERRASLEQEEYEIKIEKNILTVYASTRVGATYAVSSILQAFSFGKRSPQNISMKAFAIKDKPAYPWRGFMLDESRHFFGKEKVKSLLNWMAFYKLNKFHWHLTDEPAWRLEIQKYPLLTLVGGIGTYTNSLAPAAYYSQADIAEIIAYADERQIEVIPEIDMPGHATAANKAYPQLSGGGNDKHPDFTFHPAKDLTYSFLTNVLRETKALFPSSIIHLGGDEVSFGSDAWNSDSAIQRLKSKENLKDNKSVENYFMRRMADSLKTMDATLLVWDEMVDAGLSKDKTLLIWWRHDKPEQLTTILKSGYKTILSPRLPFYFDFVQEESHKYGRKWGKLYNPLEDVYNFSPSNYDSLAIEKNQILGIQANLWTETVTNTNRLDYLIFPRIAALAEVAWTKKGNKNYEEFKESLKKHLNLYREANLYYYDPFNKSNPEPVVMKKVQRSYIDNPE